MNPKTIIACSVLLLVLALQMNLVCSTSRPLAANQPGSSPPSCEHKCYGCSPCEAIEVPTTSRSHIHGLRLSYANYEPESWKCKCGPSFYSP
ncbi:unnamed protein product [Linum tenue]|uniref:Epidermal patterning factor-like protein n=1 Tax=Linum tenue TaxID=586396 RepID=A0AAV0KG49_9ROSI|nr:unnamed protein product [Linum tenue]CAI0419921.1 unnamed protein product [Linum tenue]